jgi:hypothetical protein
MNQIFVPLFLLYIYFHLLSTANQIFVRQISPPVFVPCTHDMDSECFSALFACGISPKGRDPGDPPKAFGKNRESIYLVSPEAPPSGELARSD